MGLGHRGKRARRHRGAWALRATALAVLPCAAAPAWSAPTPAPPVVLAKARAFALTDTRRLRALPLHLPVAPIDADAMLIGPDLPPPLDTSVADELLSQALVLRDDLHLLINSRVKDARHERITLGVKFARSF